VNNAFALWAGFLPKPKGGTKAGDQKNSNGNVAPAGKRRGARGEGDCGKNLGKHTQKETEISGFGESAEKVNIRNPGETEEKVSKWVGKTT